MREQSIGRIEFGGALLVASVFYVLAGLCLTGAFVVALLGLVDWRDGGSFRGWIYVAVSSAYVVAAAFVAFFGYLLTILVATYEQLWHIRHGER